jgi:endonuclease/exonuclease/phosphatase family metal-dependent hydrolase
MAGESDRSARCYTLTMLLKFMSLNIWDGGHFLDEVIDYIREQDPDLLFLQEVYGGTGQGLPRYLRTMEELKQALSYPYADFSADFLHGRLDGHKVKHGSAAFSKFAIKERRTSFYVHKFRAMDGDDPSVWANLPRSLQVIELDTPAGDVTAINIHGPWDLDGDRDSKERRAMAAAIVRATEGRKRVIAAGDTNARDTNPVVPEIEKHLTRVQVPGLKSSFALRHKNLAKFPGYADSIVDLMFVSHDVHVVKAECPDVSISDHRPLTATLEF